MLMKKVLGTLISCALILSSITLVNAQWAPESLPGGEWGNNDTLENANQYGLYRDTIYNFWGKIDTQYDVDYYKIVIPDDYSKGVINFFLENPSDINYRMSLYDYAGNEILESDVVGKDRLISNFNVNAGEGYYIKIYGNNGDYSDSAYKFRAKYYPSPDSLESNNTISTATGISRGSTIDYANINTLYDVDFYNVWLDDTIDLHLWSPINTDYDINVYHKDSGELVASATQTGQNEDLTFGADAGQNLTPGIYSIKIYPKNQNSYGEQPYVLSVNVPSQKSDVIEWNYSDPETRAQAGSYTPPTGFFTAKFFDGKYVNWVKTYCGFTLSPDNVESISSYNRGERKNYNNDYAEAFLAVDITSISDSDEDQMSAYSIISNLPNPKYDLEDDGSDYRYEESEVVALGQVEAKYYDVRTYWQDFRNGGYDTGRWEVQFNVSAEGYMPIVPDVHWDYNNFMTSGLIQAILHYGKYGGQK